MAVLPADLAGVGIADHVVGKDRRAHSGQGGAAVLHVGAVAPLPGELGIPGVAVRAEDRRDAPAGLGRQVEIAAEKEARGGLNGDILDGVARMRALGVAPRMQGGLLGERMKSRPFQDAPAHRRTALFPCFQAGDLGGDAVEFGLALGGLEEGALPERRLGPGHQRSQNEEERPDGRTHQGVMVTGEATNESGKAGPPSARLTRPGRPWRNRGGEGFFP